MSGHPIICSLRLGGVVVKKLLRFLCICMLICYLGCAASWNRINLSEVPDPKEESICFIYSINETLSVKITLENQRTYDAIQLGLYLLQYMEEDEQIPGVEDEKFFPKYFAMINIEIEDGLLFISEKEAKNFVCDMYLEYQKKVVPPNYLDDKQKRLLEEIIRSK